MRTSSMRIALGLAVLSLVSLAGASFVSGRDGVTGVGLVAAAMAGVLWIAAAAAFIQGPTDRLGRWLRWSLVAYGVAFVLPAAETTGAEGARQGFFGFQAFHLGLLFVTQVWLANPLYLAGLILARHGAPIPALIAIGLGLVFGLSLAVRPAILPDIGYAVWLAGIALGGVATAVDRWRPRVN